MSLQSALHGILAWGIATLQTFYLLTTAVGAIMGGGGPGTRTGVSLLGQGVVAASPGVMDSVKGQLQASGVNWDSIKDDARTMLR